MGEGGRKTGSSLSPSPPEYDTFLPFCPFPSISDKILSSFPALDVFVTPSSSSPLSLTLPVAEDFTPELPLSDIAPLVDPLGRCGGGGGGEDDLDAPLVDFTALHEDGEVVVVDRTLAAPAVAGDGLREVELAGIFEARSRFLADTD